MKVVGFVPSKLNSQRLARKNVLPLGGIPLVNYPLAALAEAGVDDVVLYAADAEVIDYVDDAHPYRYVQRPAWLDTDAAKVQDFVGSFLDDVACDVVVLLHITSPFISAVDDPGMCRRSRHPGATSRRSPHSRCTASPGSGGAH